MPLGFLETGSERFDLAFAGVEVPSPVAFSISAGLPDQLPAAIRRTPAVTRPRLIDIPQISGLSLAPLPRAQNADQQPSRQQSASQQTTYQQSASRPRRELSASAMTSRELAIANEAIEAAFAGTLDLSGGVRETLPGASASEPQTAQPASEQSAGMVPIPIPETSQSGSGSGSGAGPAVLVQKTQLDARVNGVLTGAVDFEQRDGSIAVRLGSVVDMLQDRFSASELAQLQSGNAADTFITLADLQAAGIPISYDPVYDEVSFGIDYEDAPQADKVQVEQIGTPSMGSDRTVMDQISR
ncbi:MAG: hypothetical protein ACSHXH_19250 [Marivita sp.]|uniref:hypothetical protein n=1 Tax=Marivita sp. TaxID=2003365 RepID=UPI003EF10366